MRIAVQRTFGEEYFEINLADKILERWKFDRRRFVTRRASGSCTSCGKRFRSNQLPGS
jgi:hypothetical protein